MSTTPNEPSVAKKARVPGPAKSVSVALHDAQGNILRCTAIRRADESAISFIAHTSKAADGTKVTKRGETKTHDNFEAAAAAVEKAAGVATKAGWARKAGGGGGGFRSKPDAFDLNSLPAPKRK